MRYLTPENQSLLAERHKSEFWYLLQIEWPDGTRIYSRLREDGTDPLLISITDYVSTGRVDGFGGTTVINVDLNDAYGIFKDKFDNMDLANIRATLILRGTNADHPEWGELYLPLFRGRIQMPITWSEGSRKITFTIAPAISEDVIGYTPDAGDIAASENYGIEYPNQQEFVNLGFTYDESFFVSSEWFRSQQRLNGESWPTVFGYCRNIPINSIATSPSCSSTREVWDITGGWAARSKAIAYNKASKEFNDNNAYQIAQEEVEAKPYMAIPAASGWLTIQVDNAQLFEQFEQVLVSIEFNDQMIVCRGRFYTKIQPQHVDCTPFAPKGYFVIEVGPSAAANPLPEMVNPNYTTDPHSSHFGEPHDIPNPGLPPVGWPITVPDLSGYADFNIPIYENIRIFQQMVSDDYTVDGANWPTPMTEEQKQEVIYRSLQAKTLENLPEYLTTWSETELSDLLDGNLFGYAEDQLTRFHLVGVGAGQNAIPVDRFNIRDYPWLSASFIEAEVLLDSQKPSLDASLDVTGLQNLLEWDDDGQIGYMLLPVIKQRGFECWVYNPHQFVFRRIRAVYKNNIIQKRRDFKATISADDMLTREPETRQGVIPSGSVIRFFDWLPEQQFVCDTKMGTSVLSVKYMNEEGDNYIALPSEGYLVTDASPGSLWAGWHSPATVVTLSYNSMIRHRFDAGRNNGQLYVDLNNMLNIDELIAKSAIETVNNLPGSAFADPYSFPAPSLEFSRRNSIVLREPVGIKQFLTELAFQNGKIIAGDGTDIRFINFMSPPVRDFVIEERHIVERSVVLGTTSDVSTMFDMSFRSSDLNDEIYRTVRRNNVNRYGQRKVDWNFFCYDNVVDADDVVGFWMYYFSHYWRTVKLKVTFECAGIQVFDVVGLLFNQQLNFSQPYSQVSGTVEEKGSGSTLYSSLALVQSMSFNIADGTIDMELWTPIQVGGTDQDPIIWQRHFTSGIYTQIP